MINRELNPRELEILHMIRPTTFRDIVEEVRKEVDQSRHNAKRELRNLNNGNRDTKETEETKDAKEALK